jgi:hypothetical protein
MLSAAMPSCPDFLPIEMGVSQTSLPRLVLNHYPPKKREGAEWVVREGVGAVGRNEPILVCTYE